MRFDEESRNNLSDQMMENIMSVNSSGDPKINSLIYELQQDFLPRYLFNSIPKFFIDFRANKELFLKMLIKNMYQTMFEEELSYPIDNFNFSIEIIDNELEIIQIDWDTEQTMLAKRMYFVTDLRYSKAACFLTEITFGGGLMFCRIAPNKDNSLGRLNYGPIEDNVNLEKDRIVELLLG